jgi:hypothetical protein
VGKEKTITRRYHVLIILLLLLLFTGTPARAGNWYLGGGLEYVDLGDDTGDIVDSGAGVAFNFGYRITPWFCLDFILGASWHDDIDGDDLSYGRFSIGPAFILVTQSPFEPYLTLGFAEHYMKWDDFDIEAEGDSLFVGIGFDYIINKNHCIDVGIRYHVWEADFDFGSPFTSADIDATTTTLSVLYNYHIVW